MSLTDREIIEQVIQCLDELQELIRFEHSEYGNADFSDWLDDLDTKMREAQVALSMEWEREREQDDGE